MLDDFVRFAPDPIARRALTRIVEPNESKFSGFVFKIQANMDPKHRDRIAYMRICSGRYKKGMKMIDSFPGDGRAREFGSGENGRCPRGSHRLSAQGLQEGRPAARRAQQASERKGTKERTRTEGPQPAVAAKRSGQHPWCSATPGRWLRG